MKLKIKLMREKSRMPTYETPGASGMDCYADLDAAVYVWPGHPVPIPLGFAVDLEPGYELQIRPRSGLAFKKATVGNWGTVDADFRGQVHGLLFNHGTAPIRVEPGDRMCQAVLATVLRAELEVVSELSETARGDGGFGSTGR